MRNKDWDNRLRFYKGGICKECSTPITTKNRSGYCRQHNPHTKVRSLEYRKKLSGKRLSENNPNWRGSSVGYEGLHKWVARHKEQSSICERCHNVSSLDLANISGKYLRDINDFEWLCRRCHMKSDNRLFNLKQYAK